MNLPVNRQPSIFSRSISVDSLTSLDPQLRVIVALDGSFVLAAVGRDIHSIAESLARVADRLAPRPSDIVGTPYVAQRLGCTTAWITDLIKKGKIPSHCIVAGTGNGKVWKFYRARIDEWIAGR